MEVNFTISKAFIEVCCWALVFISGGAFMGVLETENTGLPILMIIAAIVLATVGANQ